MQEDVYPRKMAGILATRWGESRIICCGDLFCPPSARRGSATTLVESRIQRFQLADGFVELRFGFGPQLTVMRKEFRLQAQELALCGSHEYALHFQRSPHRILRLVGEQLVDNMGRSLPKVILFATGCIFRVFCKRAG